MLSIKLSNYFPSGSLKLMLKLWYDLTGFSLINAGIHLGIFSNRRSASTESVPWLMNSLGLIIEPSLSMRRSDTSASATERYSRMA